MDAPLLQHLPSEEEREDNSSIETDQLDELAAIRRTLQEIMEELKAIKESLQRMENESGCIIT
jgi:phosphomevalonate kinase